MKSPTQLVDAQQGYLWSDGKFTAPTTVPESVQQTINGLGRQVSKRDIKSASCGFDTERWRNGMNNFWQMAYQQKWATLDMMKQATELQLITADEYKTITGEDYSAGTATT